MGSLIGGNFDSTIDIVSEMSKQVKILTKHGNVGDELKKRANVVIGEMEKFCLVFKKDCILFDQMSTKSHVENVKLQDELVLVKKERDDLMKELARVKEGVRIASEWAKRVEENVKDSEEHCHKNVMISELKNQVLGKDGLLNDFRERLKLMEGKVVRREQEVRELNDLKIAAYQSIGKLTENLIEANQRAEELERENVEASESTEKLKRVLWDVEDEKSKSDEELKNMKEKQLEADTRLKELSWKLLVALQAVEEFKKWTLAADESLEANKERLEGLPRVKTAEEGIIRGLKVKVLDLANSVLQAVDVNSPIPKGEEEPLRNLKGIHEGTGNEDDCFEQVGSQFHSSPPQVQTNGSTDDIEEGIEKSHCLGIIVAEDTVEVVNRDDEARPGDLEYNSDSLVSTRKRSSLGKTDGSSPYKRQKSEPTGEPSQENDECLAMESNTLNPVLGSFKEKAGVATSSQTQICTSSSDSDDEQCSDWDMDNLVRQVRFERLRKTWKSESDMLKDFQEDVELCMDAVCVLYRWKIRDRELPHFDAMGGSDLAKYLINDDPACRLIKFVSEVEEERPDGLVQCRKIATNYCEKLFSLYLNGNDQVC